MKRTAFLALATALLAGCEKPTAPASRERPDALLAAPATTTTFSGRATVLKARVLNLAEIDLGDTGPLPEGGGALDGSLVTLAVPPTLGLLEASAVLVHSSTIGQGNQSSAEVSVATVNLTVANNVIRADLLRSQAEATCDGAGQASTSGSSEIAGLVVNSQTFTVSGNPNQVVVDQADLKVVINEQNFSANGSRADITVNALHVTAFDPLNGGATLADVVISSSHADITCGTCTPPVGDYVTGGGWITGTPSGARANFGVAGGNKNDGLWGHLIYIDHGPNGFKVKGTGVTSYEATGLTSRRIKGTAEVDGVGGFTYIVDVTDAGEPGRDDTFSITLSNGYFASGKLAGGNIKLHPKPSPCF